MAHTYHVDRFSPNAEGALRDEILRTARRGPRPDEVVKIQRMEKRDAALSEEAIELDTLIEYFDA